MRCITPELPTHVKTTIFTNDLPKSRLSLHPSTTLFHQPSTRKPFPSSGTCDLDIFIENRTVKQSVHVLDNLSHDLLLWQDFWRQHSLLFDLDHPILKRAYYTLEEQPDYSLDSDAWEDLDLSNDANSKWEDLDEDSNHGWEDPHPDRPVTNKNLASNYPAPYSSHEGENSAAEDYCSTNSSDWEDMISEDGNLSNWEGSYLEGTSDWGDTMYKAASSHYDDHSWIIDLTDHGTRSHAHHTTTLS